MMRRAPRPILFLVLLGLAACRETTALACTSEGPSWEVSPSQITVAAGHRVTVNVIQITCSGKHRVPVYPFMSVADTSVAFVSNTERYLQGRARGSTTLTLSGDNGVLPRQVPVVVP